MKTNKDSAGSSAKTGDSSSSSSSSTKSNSPSKAAMRAGKAGQASGKKRAAIFSKSRDTREDRGIRQAQTAGNRQTISHGK